MLLGTLRCGSGITGSGGVERVAPVVVGPLVSALNCMLSRPFGAGFGIGTACCAVNGAACANIAVAITAAVATIRCERAGEAAIRNFRLLFNA
jgi:hypothetical protein